MFENLKFRKTGFKTCVLEKYFISYSCILFLIFNALRNVFKNRVIFSKMMFFQIFDWSNMFFDQSKFLLKFFVSFCLFRSIENCKWAFLKVRSWLVQNIFFKSFSNFPLSLSLPDSARLHKEFFIVFLQNSCKVSLSLSLYVYFTLPFALFFSFSCIISWFLGNFWTMLNLGFLIN